MYMYEYIIYIYIYICMYTCIHTHAYLHIHIFTCTYIYSHVRICTVHTNTHTHLYASMDLWIYVECTEVVTVIGTASLVISSKVLQVDLRRGGGVGEGILILGSLAFQINCLQVCKNHYFLIQVYNGLFTKIPMQYIRTSTCIRICKHECTYIHICTSTSIFQSLAA